MLNLWRVANNLWLFVLLEGDDQGDHRKQIHRFRAFLRAERLKMLVGIPLAYTAVWFLFIDPWPGLSYAEILAHYSAQPLVGLVLGAPLIGIVTIPLIASAAYTVFGLLFLIGWIQVRYFGFKRW